MKARTYVRLYMCFGGMHILFLLLGIFFLSLTCLMVYGHFAWGFAADFRGFIAVAVCALMAILFLSPLKSAVMQSKKYCDSLEQRGLMEDAASQLSAQGRWGEDHILTNDYYFCNGGEVICLKDLVRIELVRKQEYDDAWGNCEQLTLRLSTRQGDTLTPSRTYRLRAKERDLQQHFAFLQSRYPEIAAETVSQEK